MSNAACPSTGLDRIRELTASIGLPPSIERAPGILQYETIAGTVLVWNLHWQTEFAVAHAFLSANSHVKLHAHDEKEWFIIISGYVNIIVDGIEKTLRPKEEMAIEPGVWHELRCDVDTYLVAISMPAGKDWPK